MLSAASTAPASIDALAPAAYGPRYANVRITLVTLQTSDKTAADAAAIDVNAAQAAVSSVSNYWASMSAGRMTMNVERTITGFKTSAASYNEFSVIMDTVARELGWTAGTDRALVMLMPRNDVIVYGSGGNLGASWSSGPTSGRILLPTTSNWTSPVMAHEFGHLFGLGHANSLQCTNGRADVASSSGRYTDPACTSRAYGDTTDLMGISQWSLPQINAALYAYGGFGRGDEIRNIGTISAPGSYTLTAWAGTAAQRALKFTDPANGVVYYVQLRLPVGYDASTAVNGNRGVEIIRGDLHENESLLLPPSTLPYSGWYITQGAWQAGQTFTTFGGTRVRIDSISSTSAQVSITPSGTDYQGSLQVPATEMDAKAATYGLGAPTGALVTGLRNGGAYRTYQGGAVYWSPTTGIRVVVGAIRWLWGATGAQDGFLGYPRTDEIPGLRDGGVRQEFQGGAVYWTPSYGAVLSGGAIRTLWGHYGFENGYLGYPVLNEKASDRGGAVQDYERGAIYYHATFGTHHSIGAIRSVYASQGWERGYLGYPTTDEVPGLGGGAHQTFERGTISYVPGHGTFISVGAIRWTWLNFGGQSGWLGWPTSNEYPTGDGGVSQNFQGGKITYRSGSISFIRY